ncbi:hypothetical protein [Oceaniglobus roseus]|uniref:hypothetical protein n=1 Tax=Oceaniglobus roseus TaxID=1737570 RepID=UPI000C7EB4F2|nr:hypothetical protein [Kandeliimicrobium roseum]
MRRSLSAATLLLLLPAMAGAGQSREALYTVLAAHDCSIAPGRVADVFSPQGFTPEFVRSTLTELMLDGTASQNAAGVLSLPISLCPPEKPVPSPRDEVIARFRDNGCSFSNDDVPELLSSLDLSDAQLRAIVYPLHDAGDLTVSGHVATLSPALCGATTD